MDLALRIFNGGLMLFASYLGIKHGWAGLSGKAEIIDMFHKWNIGKTGVTIVGAVTLLGVILMFIPKTFLWGNFLTATTILLIICLQLQARDLKGVMIEIPFLLLSLLIIYLRHPLAREF